MTHKPDVVSALYYQGKTDILLLTEDEKVMFEKQGG